MKTQLPTFMPRSLIGGEQKKGKLQNFEQPDRDEPRVKRKNKENKAKKASSNKN